MIARHVTTKSGISTLESLDGTERRQLPAYLVNRNGGEQVYVDDAEWVRGAELTIEFQEEVVSVVALRAAFHKRGLWSTADIRARPSEARAAVADVLGDVVGRILGGN